MLRPPVTQLHKTATASAHSLAATAKAVGDHNTALSATLSELRATNDYLATAVTQNANTLKAALGELHETNDQLKAAFTLNASSLQAVLGQLQATNARLTTVVEGIAIILQRKEARRARERGADQAS